MLLSPRPASTPADLLRLLAVWLALLLLVQGFAAVHAGVAGPAHQHRVHASVNLLAHQHHHVENQRHRHAVLDASVLTQAEAAALDEALDAAAAALAAAFLLLASDAAVSVGRRSGRVWRAALGWTSCMADSEPLLKPPQRG